MNIEIDEDTAESIFKAYIKGELEFYRDETANISLEDFVDMPESYKEDALTDLAVFRALKLLDKVYNP